MQVRICRFKSLYSDVCIECRLSDGLHPVASILHLLSGYLTYSNMLNDPILEIMSGNQSVTAKTNVALFMNLKKVLDITYGGDIHKYRIG